MAIDIGQFFDDFFEECMEALETIESGLLDPPNLSGEGINSCSARHTPSRAGPPPSA
jgi:hypothetical protein